MSLQKSFHFQFADREKKKIRERKQIQLNRRIKICKLNKSIF